MNSLLSPTEPPFQSHRPGSQTQSAVSVPQPGSFQPGKEVIILVANVLAWAAGDMVLALFLTLPGYMAPGVSLCCNHPSGFPSPVGTEPGLRVGLQSRPALSHLCFPSLEPSVRSANPDLSSPCLPSCSAACAHFPHTVRCGPRHRRPQTAADCQRGTAAPSRQLPPTWPQGSTRTPNSSTRSWGASGPGAGLRSRPLPRFLRRWGSWLGPAPPFTGTQVIWLAYMLSTGVRVPP